MAGLQFSDEVEPSRAGAPSDGAVSITQDLSTGKLITSTTPGSFMWTLWSGYVEFVDAYLAGPLQINLDPWGILVAVIWFLPQFVVALTGGLLAVLVPGRWGNAVAHRQPGFTPRPL
jgi:hypothetical protein